MAPASSRAAGLLDQVPRDALGVVVVRNVSATDAKVAKFLGNVGVPLPGPLQLLKSFTGIDAGLDSSRELMLVVLPADGEAQPLHLAMWLPVDDYDGFVRSLDGDPQRQIAAVTVAGEDLFVARHDNWAVMVDPDQRVRLERLRTSAAAPSQSIAAWEPWTAENDVTLVAFPAGVRAARSWSAKQSPAGRPVAAPAEQGGDGLFEPASEDNPVDQFWAAISTTCGMLIAELPDLERWIIESRGMGCGLKLDSAGSAVIGARSILPAAATSLSAVESDSSLPNLFPGGEFVLVGSGHLDPRWSILAVAPSVRNMADYLATNFGDTLDGDDVQQFRRAVEQAMADVHGFAVLVRPGRGKEGVFTNRFFALRVGSNAAFLERTAEAMRQWNKMFDRDGAALPLAFESLPTTVAERPGTEYSIDMGGGAMAAALGGQPIPEFREAIEKLFGSGGKFRLQVVSVDGKTVLLAAATQEQAAEAIVQLSQAVPQSKVADDTRMRTTAGLLPADADWRLYFSPHGYNHWLKRQMDAVLGPVIGGPVVRDFAASPPIGVVGGLDDDTAWVELALPAETQKAIRKYVGQ